MSFFSFQSPTNGTCGNETKEEAERKEYGGDVQNVSNGKTCPRSRIS